jgi:hypothetical protein
MLQRAVASFAAVAPRFGGRRAEAASARFAYTAVILGGGRGAKPLDDAVRPEAG